MKARYSIQLLTIFGFLLAVLCTALFGMRLSKLWDWEIKLSLIENTMTDLVSSSKEKEKAKEVAARADPCYLQNVFSQMPLLNLERGALELLDGRGKLSDEKKEKLRFISTENFISFHSHKKTGSEVEEKMVRSVQVDEYDLPKILEKLEGNPESPTRIKRLLLEKCPSSFNYNLYLELWRKES